LHSARIVACGYVRGRRAGQARGAGARGRNDTITSMKTFGVILMFTALAAVAPAQDSTEDLARGWLPEFNTCARQLLALAEAMPAEKFAWRPGPGVRSVSEVYMHIAAGNFFFLQSVGVKVNGATLPKDPEKSVTAKADVIKWLKLSLDSIRDAYPGTDKQKALKFFGHDVTADGIFLRVLAHNNEHLGQGIAYARFNGVVPPWSK
jgi:uncharacterized damage-inducible protein DinB